MSALGKVLYIIWKLFDISSSILGWVLLLAIVLMWTKGTPTQVYVHIENPANIQSVVDNRFPKEMLLPNLARVGSKDVLLDKPVFELLFDCKASPCLISKSQGGNVQLYMLAAKAATILRDWTFVITGECDSACALFADFARPYVYITKDARFGFHKMYKRDGSQLYDFSNPPQHNDIDSYVKGGGGYPEDGVNYMSAKDAKQFWPTCELDLVLRPIPCKSTATTAK